MLTENNLESWSELIQFQSGKHMIQWQQYKEYKVIALRLIDSGYSVNSNIQHEIDCLFEDLQSEHETVENIINILSNYEHKKPL